jgi:endo-1,4-beta-xylanase
MEGCTDHGGGRLALGSLRRQGAAIALVLFILTLRPAFATDEPAADAAVGPEPPCVTFAPPESPVVAEVALADAARPHGLTVGSSIGYYAPWPIAAHYKAILAREFAIVTPENEMKWSFIHPQRDRYSFGPADCIVQFAVDHNLAVRGHTLAWHDQMPAWTKSLELSRDGWIDMLHNHIRTVVGHFKTKFPGRVVQWDVVNEPIADETCKGKDHCALRNAFWTQKIGPEYIDLAFRFAKETDPAARLYLNEFELELRTDHADARRRAFFRLLDTLKQRNVPIDGVGLEFHVSADDALTDLKLLLDGIAERGLDIAITEIDVRVGETPSALTLQKQTSVFRQAIDACLDQPRCKTFVMWGFTDAWQWQRQWMPAPMDTALRPKPAWGAMLDELKHHPVIPRSAAQSPVHPSGAP